MNNMERDFIKKQSSDIVKTIISNGNLFDNIAGDKRILYSYIALKMVIDKYRRTMIDMGYKESIFEELNDMAKELYMKIEEKIK